MSEHVETPCQRSPGPGQTAQGTANQLLLMLNVHIYSTPRLPLKCIVTLNIVVVVSV